MTADQIAAQAASTLSAIVSSPTQILALFAAAAAAALMITSAFVKTMVPLRWLAVCANCGFLAFGLLHPSLVTALLYATLLPINMFRLREMRRLTRRVSAAAASADASLIWLRPYMKQTRRKAGDVIFEKGDEAEHLFMLVDGRVEFVEIQESVGPGQVFGEIAFFAPGKRRTLTARCAEDCHVLSVNHRTVREIYFQNPAFGFELIGLVASRLSADVTRLQEQLAAAKAALGVPVVAGEGPDVVRT